MEGTGGSKIAKAPNRPKNRGLQLERSPLHNGFTIFHQVLSSLTVPLSAKLLLVIQVMVNAASAVRGLPFLPRLCAKTKGSDSHLHPKSPTSAPNPSNSELQASRTQEMPALASASCRFFTAFTFSSFSWPNHSSLDGGTPLQKEKTRYRQSLPGSMYLVVLAWSTWAKSPWFVLGPLAETVSIIGVVLGEIDGFPR